MYEARITCRKLCDEENIKIYFNEEHVYFFASNEMNKCAVCDNEIVCSEFSSWNYDLLVFAVLHEIGYILLNRQSSYIDESAKDPCDYEFKNGFAREHECWNFAIMKYMEKFGQNIGIKHGRYMVDCLSTYLPNFTPGKDNGYSELSRCAIEEEKRWFWCPIKEKIID